MEIKDLYRKMSEYVLLLKMYKDGVFMGSGTAFMTGTGYFITNYHVMEDIFGGIFQGENYTLKIFLPQKDGSLEEIGCLSLREIEGIRTIYCSEERFNDYVILRIDKKNEPLKLSSEDDVYIGQKVAILGYPFGKEHLSINQGIISSIYRQCGIKVFQIDGSVNRGNSGGPLVDIETGKILGIITRKEDGLSDIFKTIKKITKSNYAFLKNFVEQPCINISGYNPAEAEYAAFGTLMDLFKQIERSANVGIGYAFSLNKIMEDLESLKAEEAETI